MLFFRHFLRRYRIRLLPALLLCGLSIALPAGPAQGFSVSEEKELGERLLVLIRKEFKLLDEPDITGYVRKLGRKILAVAGPQFFDYHFFVINNKEFNAFAAPSGLIFIHSGLIEATATEGELLGVLAHEVGHAASRHYADRLGKSKKINMGTTALALAGMVLGGGSALGEAVMAGSMATGTTLGLQFSRQDEEEADRLAYKWMREMSRDPAEILGMLKKMRAISRYRRAQLPAYLLTHPEPEQRQFYIEDRLFMDRAPTRPKARDEAEEFEFQRVKYRILSLTRPPHELLPLLQNKLKDGDQALDSFMARYGLVQVHLANRDHDQALAELHRIMSRFPNQPLLLADLGLINLEAGRLEQARQFLADAAARAPENPYILFHLARVRQQAGQLAEASTIYEQLLGLIPDYSRLHYRLGQLRADQGQKVAGHYHLGLYHWYEGDVKMARHHLNEALKGAPEEDPVHQQAKEQLAEIDRLEKS